MEECGEGRGQCGRTWESVLKGEIVLGRGEEFDREERERRGEIHGIDEQILDIEF